MFNKLVILCILLFWSIVEIEAKVYKRCELVSELKNRHKIPYEDIGDWICIMFWESGLDTKAHRVGNFDGSSNYGILQINDLLWCQSTGRKNNTNFCDASCDKFRDSNISDDIKCALLIYKLQGFDAWGAFNTKCRSDTSSYVEGCGVKPMPPDLNRDNSTETETKLSKSPQIAVPSVKDAKKKNALMAQLVQMSKTSMAIPERIFGGLKKRRSTGRATVNAKQVNKSLRRAKRGLLGQDSINPFEDARVFVFNPLCCFNWKAAEMEWSNAKNWYKPKLIDRFIALLS